MNIYDMFKDQNLDLYGNTDISIEARNVLNDKFIRINNQKVFFADKSASEPVLVFSLLDTPEESKELFKQIKLGKDSKLLVKRWKLYYMPRQIKCKLPSNNVIKNTNQEYAQAKRTKKDYGILALVNDPKMVKNDSGMVDLAYLTTAIKHYTINQKRQMNIKLRSAILEIYKAEILKFTGYQNRVLYAKSPFLSDTNIRTAVQDNMLKNVYKPILFFIEWFYDNPDEFKAWLRENSISIMLEGFDGRVLVLSGKENVANLPTYKPKVILKYMHILDGKTEIEANDMFAKDAETKDAVVPDDEIEEIKETADAITEKVLTDDDVYDNPSQIISLDEDIPEEEETEDFDSINAPDEIDEALEEALSDMSYVQHKKPEELLQIVAAKNAEVTDDIIEVEQIESETNTRATQKDYFAILSDAKMPREEKAIELAEVHNYTKLKETLETPKVVNTRKKLLSKTVRPVDEVARDMKLHVLKPAEFNDIPSTASARKSTIATYNQNYKEKFAKEDRMRLLIQPISSSMPLMLENYKEEDISDSEFAGDLATIEYATPQGEVLKFELEIPKTVNGKLYIGGSYKDINNQDAAKPVIKTDQDVIITTAYNKCMLSLKGKYPSTAAKCDIMTLKNFSKYSSILKVKTTDELGKFIYENRVSYNMIHLNKHFNGMLSDRCNLDFRGIKKDDSGFTYMGTYMNEPVYHDPETDTMWAGKGAKEESLNWILSVVKLHDEDLFKQSLVKNVTISQVNYVSAKILGQDIPVVFVLLTAISLNELLKRLKDTNELQYKIVKNDTDVDKFRNNGEYGVVHMQDKTLLLKYNNVLNEIILAPLTTMDLSEYTVFDITNVMEDLMNQGNTSIHLENFVDRFIDADTQRICEYYNIPSDFVGIFIYASSLFTSYKTTYRSDSRNYRLIGADEIINRCIYDVIAKELSSNTSRMKRGSRPKINIPRDAVIRRLQALPNMSESNDTLSPFRTIMGLTSKSLKGHYGINEARAYNMETRMFNKNNMGTETIATAYSANAGIIKYLPFDPMISNATGEYEHHDSPDDLKPANIFSFAEMFTPYIMHDHMVRITMMTGQYNHIRPVADADPMLISSYVDEAAIHMTPEFSYIGKGTGKIVSINDQFCKIKYDDGTIDIISLENVERNSDKGYYIKNDFVMDDKYKVGSTVNKGDVIAYSKAFYKKKANGRIALAHGKLTNVLICDGEGVWEDSCVPFSDLSDALANRIVKRVARVLDLNTEIRDYVTQIGMEVEPSTVLFKYKPLFEDETINSVFANSDAISLKQVDAKSKGRIVDIRLYYRRAQGGTMSPSMKKFIKDVDDVQRVTKHMIDLDDVTDKFSKSILSCRPTELKRGKFSKIGGDTIENGEILIEYKIETIDKLGPADKIVVHSALKAEPTIVLDKSLRPTGAETGRKASLMFSTYSELARMVGGITMAGKLHSILLHTAIKARMILNIPPEKDSLLDYKSCRDMVEGKLKYK